ncbi:MAG: hypothetical protein ACLQSR_11385 [Limisphaerales bacterium]
MNSPETRPKSDLRIWFFIFGVLFVGALAINDQSFWIDEASTALKSRQPTLLDWWHEMLRVRGSDMQMPLYMIWIWICGRVVGSGEVALRAVNLFWFAPGMWLLWHSLRRQPRLQLCLFVAAILSPFAWYYLAEARPYAMQMGASLCLLAAILHWSENKNEIDPCPVETFWVVGFALAIFALCGASMLGVIWAAAAVLILVFLLPKVRLFSLAQEYLLVWGMTVGVLAGLGVFYLYTLKSGARASDIGTTGLKNVFFVAYELLGFSGLGPGRLDIRSGGLSVFKPYLPELALFAVANAVVLFSGFRELAGKISRKRFVVLSAIVALPVLLLLAAGVALHFRVLGRHLAPLFAVVVLVSGSGMMNLWARGAVGRAVVIGYCLLCLTSGLELRFASRHARDDYRDAAALARQTLAEGRRVWWNADANAGVYYHLPETTNAAAAGAALLVSSPSREFLTSSIAPQTVVSSRPDIYDSRGTLAEFLAENGYQKAATLPAFVIWTKPAGR